MNVLRKLATVAVLTAAATTTSIADSLYWKGTGTTKNWSTGGNWDSGIPPATNGIDFVSFEDSQLPATGYTNVLGAVNNIVNTNYSTGAANYGSLSPYSDQNVTNAAFYTTLIPAGVSLTLGAQGSGAIAALAVGDIPGLGFLNNITQTNYSTITGAGTLNVTNNNEVITVGMANGATLDLAGLSKFNVNLRQVFIGASPDNPWPVAVNGWLLLAKTNTITTVTNLSKPGILLGYGTNSSYGGAGVIILGATNAFNTDGLSVGGVQSYNSFPYKTLIAFDDAYKNATPLPTFTLRGSVGGSTPIETFSIGDQSASPDGYFASSFPNYTFTNSTTADGLVDFSGGYVDILANNIIVGRSSLVMGGGGTGRLVVEHGTVTANNVFVGQKLGTNNQIGVGTLTLKGDCVMNVVSNFTLGYKTNLNNASAGIGSLSVNDSAVLNVSGNFITGYTNTGHQSITNGGRIYVGGVITNYSSLSTVDLSLAGGLIFATNGSTMDLYTLNGSGTITNISTTTVSNGMTLGAIHTGSVHAALSYDPGTLDVEGNLSLLSAFPIQFKLGSDVTPGGPNNDYLTVANNLTLTTNQIDFLFLGQPNTNGSYDLIHYGGALTGSVTNIFNNTTRNYTFNLDQTVTNHILLTVAGGPPATLTWYGATNVWDLTNTVAWNTNTEKFYSYDQVVFDDTGVQTVISIPRVVVMGGMTFNNNTKPYTLVDYLVNKTGGKDFGKISGFGGLTKNGTGTVILDMNDNTHDFAGPININNGVIQNQSVSAGVGGSSGGLFGATNNVITIANGASLDLYGNVIGANFGSSGVFIGIGYPIIFSGSGFNGIGAIADNSVNFGGSSSVLYTPSATLAGNASIGVTSAGASMMISGTSLGAKFDLGSNTLTTIGAGDTILSSFIATNNGDIQVNGNSLTLDDVQLGGNGTLIVGSKILGLGAANNSPGGGSGWSSTYGVSKAISIGGTIMAAGVNPQTAGLTGVTIPVSSLITLTGNITITNNQSIDLSGVVSGGYGITKQGAASLIIDAADTFTGPTIVNAGTLVLGGTGSVANSPLVRIDAGAAMDVSAQPGSYTIPTGQTVQMDGTAQGNFTVPAGAIISGSGTFASTVNVNGGLVLPARLDLPSTLAVGTLNCTNASFIFELNAATTIGGGVNDLVKAGTLSFNGTNTIKIDPTGFLNTNGGQYTLFTYTGATLPSTIVNNLVLSDDTGYTFTFVDPGTTPGSIKITVTGGGSNKVWAGGQPSAPTAWDYNTTSNWLTGVSQVKFFNRDSVTFDDNGLTNVVNIVSNIRPVAVTFTNNSLAYTLQGSARLYADSMTNSGTAGVTIANATDNALTIGGLFLNAGTVTFNQPVNATFNAKLTGTNLSAGLVKAGTNVLTLIGNSGASFKCPITVNSGTLQAGGSNTFGGGTVTIATNATADLNGQIMVSNVFVLSGAGVGGLGALNNTGGQQTNAVRRIILTNDATIGAVSRWDLVPGATSAFQGNSNNLTKVGNGSIFIGPKQNAGLNNINITAGELAFAWQGTDLGPTNGLITVQSNATLAFAYDIAAGAKPTMVMPGGQIGAEFVQMTNIAPAFGSNNSYAGDITFMSNGIINLSNYFAGLTLSGGLHGSYGLVKTGRGLLTLSGKNDYSGDFAINLGNVIIKSSNSIPTNTSVSLNCLGVPGFDTVELILSNNIATPSNAFLNMISYNQPLGPSFPTLSGNGTWNGPINVTTVQTDDGENSAININSGLTNISVGSTKLVLNGPITQSSFRQMALNLSGPMPGTIAFNKPLVWNGTITAGDRYFSNWLGNAATLINTFELNTNGNSFTNFSLTRGKLRIGADNAYPSGCPLYAGLTNGDNYAEDRQIIDLNGHFQTFSNIIGQFTSFGSHWIGNDSTNSNATVIFDSSGILNNIWGCWIVDNLNTNLSTPKKTGLTVLSGSLRLMDPFSLSSVTISNWAAAGPTNNAYSGPTLVQGGLFQCDAPVYNSAVTVSGTGTLKGTGPFYQPVNINSGGTVSPGGGVNFEPNIGVLTISNTLTLAAGSTTLMKVQVIPSVANDSVRGLTTVNYGGTLAVSKSAAGNYTTNNSFKFFFANSYVGTFASFSPLAPRAGFVWNTNTLATDGTLRIASVSTVRPTLAKTISGGNLTLTWPLDHVGYRLQVQTNQLSTGLTNSWYTVPNSTNLNSFTVQITNINPTVFYRLVYP